MKRILAMVVSVVLVATMAIGGSIAYLQDSDSAVNVMTLGEVKIEQWEKEWGKDENGKDALVEFTQGKPLYPYVGKLGWKNDGEANGAYRSFTMNNVVDKYVTVENTGKSDAYVRTIIALEMGEYTDPVAFRDSTNGIIGVSRNVMNGVEYQFPGAWEWEEPFFTITLDGNNYLIMTAVHHDAVKSGETTIPSLLQVYMNQKCNNAEVDKVDGNDNGMYDILVVSQGVQTAGFEDGMKNTIIGTAADDALNDAFGVVDAAYAVELFSGVKAKVVTNQEELNAAVAEIAAGGSGVITLAKNNYKVPGTVAGKTIRFIGTEDGVVISHAEVNNVSGAELTFENVTIQGIDEDYKGLQHIKSATYNNCIIDKSLTLYADDVAFNNCTFNLVNRYIWTYGADNVLFSECIFDNKNSKAILVYQEKDSETCYVTVQNCTFLADEKGYTGSGDWTAAVEIDTSLAPAEVTIKNCSYDENYSAIYRVKKGTCNVVAENISTAMTVSDEAELASVLKAAGKANAGNSTVSIKADLDMSQVDWTPITVDGYHGADIVTVKGNGNTITGLDAPLFAGGFAGGSGIIIKDLTIESADMDANGKLTTGYGAFIAAADSMDTITLDNCHVKNSTIAGGVSRTGGLVGWTSGYSNENDGPVKTYVTITNCSVINCDISGSAVGGINGHAGASDWTYTTIENCLVKDCDLTSTDDGDWRVGVVVGTANIGEVTIKNITASGNTLTQTGKTAPDGQSNLYGRFVPGTTGKLTIDGVEVK